MGINTLPEDSAIKPSQESAETIIFQIIVSADSFLQKR